MDDHGLLVKEALLLAFPELALKHEFVLDPCGLFDTINTLHENHEYMLRR